MTDESEQVYKLVHSFREKFQCDTEALDIPQNASQSRYQKNVAVTYVLTTENSDQVLRYYT